MFLTVVGNGVRLAGDRHHDLVADGRDGQLAILGLGDDVLLVLRDRALCALAERNWVLARIGAGTGSGDAIERGRSLARSVALKRLLLTVVGLGAGLGGQLDVLVVVDVNRVLAGLEHDTRVLARLDGVAIDVLEVERDDIARRLVIDGRGLDELVAALIAPAVVDRELGGLLGPLGRDGHVVARHGEGVTALDGGLAVETLHGPTGKVIAFLGRLTKNGMCLTLVNLVARGGAIAPRAAIEVVEHVATRNVLGVEREVLRAHGVGHAHRLGEVRIRAPTRERVLHTVDRLGGGVVELEVRGRGLAAGKIGRAGAHGDIARIPLGGIPHVVAHRVQVRVLDTDLAVNVDAIVVVGHLVGDELDGFNVVLGHRDARKLLFDELLIVGVDLVPMRRAALDGERRCARRALESRRPRHDAVARVVNPGLSVVLRECLGIDKAGQVDPAGTDLLPSVEVLDAVKVAIGVVQVIENDVVGRRRGLGDRHVMGGGQRGLAVLARPRDRDRRRALGHTRDLTVLIDGQDMLVVGRPCIGAVFLGIGERRLKLDGVELLDLVGTGDLKRRELIVVIGILTRRRIGIGTLTRVSAVPTVVILAKRVNLHVIGILVILEITRPRGATHGLAVDEVLDLVAALPIVDSLARLGVDDGRGRKVGPVNIGPLGHLPLALVNGDLVFIRIADIGVLGVGAGRVNRLACALEMVQTLDGSLVAVGADRGGIVSAVALKVPLPGIALLLGKGDGLIGHDLGRARDTADSRVLLIDGLDGVFFLMPLPAAIGIVICDRSRLIRLNRLDGERRAVVAAHGLNAAAVIDLPIAAIYVLVLGRERIRIADLDLGHLIGRNRLRARGGLGRDGALDRGGVLGGLAVLLLLGDEGDLGGLGHIGGGDGVLAGSIGLELAGGAVDGEGDLVQLVAVVRHDGELEVVARGRGDLLGRLRNDLALVGDGRVVELEGQIGRGGLLRGLGAVLRSGSVIP